MVVLPLKSNGLLLKTDSAHQNNSNIKRIITNRVTVVINLT